MMRKAIQPGGWSLLTYFAARATDRKLNYFTFRVLRKSFILLAGLLVVPLFGCTLPVGQTAIVESVIYPRQVPASFEAIIVYRTIDAGDTPVSYKWSCDNGTIKGEGRSVVWVTPDIPGIYTVAVKATIAGGREVDSRVNIGVVPFIKNDIDINPSVVMQIPSANNETFSEQVCTDRLITVPIDCPVARSDSSKYTFAWSCNGGKLLAPGLKERTASKVGWTSPGVGGNYTVKVLITDSQDNISVGHVFINVKTPRCCPPPNSEEVIQWKK
jgi:hypothetical protein